MSRVIEGLNWAKPLHKKPLGIPRSSPKGAKAFGVRYERGLVKHLAGFVPGQWWEFEDANGKGYCQTDFYRVFPGFVWVLEAKYTWTEKAWPQLSKLYFPVLEKAYGKPVVGTQVCKNLKQGIVTKVTVSLKDALQEAQEHKLSTLHWTGIVPIGGLGPS